MSPRRHFRVFLSSPGDVAKERDIAREFIDLTLPKRPGLRDRVTFESISWDDHHASAAMPAHLTPQEAINQGPLPRPSECDIVIVILWSRLGTPLPKAHVKHDGSPFLSGTEWEFEDALTAAKEKGVPTTLVYRRSEVPTIGLDDPELNAKREQYQKVKAFFERFKDHDGSLAGSYHTYSDPGDFRRLLSQHLEEAIQLLVEQAVAVPGTTPRVPFMVDNLPEDFVPRPKEMETLIGTLLDENQTEPVAISAALRGAGGYGKTTLARAICHDERIQDAFSDGIVWITLGEEPGELTGRVIDLIHTLTGRREAFDTMDAAINRFKELLGDRQLLIVIDDIWNGAHLRPFLEGGPNCARLITTRFTAVLPERAERILVDAMQVNEAIDLLRPAAPQQAVDALTELAARLGEWPLLLKLAGAMLKEREHLGQKLEDAVVWVNTALDRRGVTAFDASDPEARDQAVGMTLNASLDQLKDTDRQLFAELAVFPEDVEIPLAALEVLWDLDTFDAEECCQRFFQGGLLWSLDLTTRRMRLHDVIRAYLRSPDLDLKVLDSKLVEAYRQRCDGAWHNVNDDGYVVDWLPSHLFGAGRHDELRELIFDLRWMQSKLLVRNITALVADVALIYHDQEAEQLSRALRMSGHIVSLDLDQLPAQLLGRLSPESGTQIERLLDQAHSSLDPSILVPVIKQHLLSPGPLRQTFQGHSEGVWGALLLDDDRSALSWSFDHTLRLWDLESGESRALTGHSDQVWGALLLDDGRRALSWSRDHTLRLWDLENGESRVLEGHTDIVAGALLLDDGRRALSWAHDHTLRLWDLESGGSRTLEGHTDEITGALLLDDGRRALSWSNDHTLRLWNLDSGESRALKGHKSWVTGALLLDDGRNALSWSNDHTLRLWNLDSGESRALKGHVSWVSGALLLDDGRRALSWSDDDGPLRLWDLESGESRVLEGHSTNVTSASLLDDGRRALSWSGDRTLRLWDLKSSDSRTFEGHTDTVAGVLLLDNGRRALSWAERDITLRLWEPESGESRALEGHTKGVTGALLLDDGRHAISWSDDHMLRYWDLESGDSRAFEGHTKGVSSVLLMDDNRRALSWSADHTLRLWDLESGESSAFEGHTDTVAGALLLDGGRCALSWAKKSYTAHDRTLDDHGPNNPFSWIQDLVYQITRTEFSAACDGVRPRHRGLFKPDRSFANLMINLNNGARCLAGRSGRMGKRCR